MSYSDERIAEAARLIECYLRAGPRTRNDVRLAMADRQTHHLTDLALAVLTAAGSIRTRRRQLVVVTHHDTHQGRFTCEAWHFELSKGPVPQRSERLDRNSEGC